MLDPSFRPGDGEEAYGKEYAKWEDEHDSLRHFREEFVIPSKEDLKRKRLSITDGIYVLAHFGKRGLSPLLTSYLHSNCSRGSLESTMYLSLRKLSRSTAP